MSLEDWLLKWLLSEAFHERLKAAWPLCRETNAEMFAERTTGKMRRGDKSSLTAVRCSPGAKKQTHRSRSEGADAVTPSDTKDVSIVSFQKVQYVTSL